MERSTAGATERRSWNRRGTTDRASGRQRTARVAARRHAREVRWQDTVRRSGRRHRGATILSAGEPLRGHGGRESGCLAQVTVGGSRTRVGGGGPVRDERRAARDTESSVLPDVVTSRAAHSSSSFDWIGIGPAAAHRAGVPQLLQNRSLGSSRLRQDPHVSAPCSASGGPASSNLRIGAPQAPHETSVGIPEAPQDGHVQADRRNCIIRPPTPSSTGVAGLAGPDGATPALTAPE